MTWLNWLPELPFMVSAGCLIGAGWLWYRLPASRDDDLSSIDETTNWREALERIGE